MRTLLLCPKGEKRGHAVTVNVSPPSTNGGTGKTYQKEVLTNSGGNGKIKADERFEIHSDKIKEFLLKPNAKHSQEFFDVGYGENDYERLFDDIAFEFSNAEWVDIRNSDAGVMDFSTFMQLGIGDKKRFRIVWRKDTPNSKPRLITGHRED